MFNKVMEYAGPWQKTIRQALFLLIAAVLFSILPYFFLYQIVSVLLKKTTLPLSFALLQTGLAALCLFLHALLYVKGLSLSHLAAYNTLKNLRITLQKKLEGLPMGVILEKGTGSFKKLFIDDIESIELLLAHALPEGIANIAVPLLVYGVMFLVDWRLALLSLASFPFGIIAMMIMYKIGSADMANYYQAAAKMNNTIIEYVNGMEVVKIFNRDEESFERYQNDIRSYRDFTLAWYKACWPWMALYSSILPCTALLLLPLGALLVLKGYCTLDHLVLILCLSFSIGAPLLRSLSFISTLPQINYRIETLEKIFNSAPLRQKENAFTGKDHTVQFDHVSFAYQDSDVLHDITFTLQPKTLTALVGASGSGKSTLAKLLVHFYDVKSGVIKIGGQPIEEMSLDALMSQIAYVSQEQFLFNLSLRDNIRLSRLNASDEEVNEAACKAQCMDFINELEMGLDTLAGDGGKQLSGGQRQRIALARALLKDAPIIVLDEATASFFYTQLCA